MAVETVTDTKKYNNIFHQIIITNLAFWNEHEALKSLDIKMLDRDRKGVLRAILFGLDFGKAWSATQKLIIAFTPYMERRGDWEQWSTILEQAIHLAEKNKDLNTLLTLLVLLARLFQRRGLVKETIICYRRVLSLARRTGNDYEKARACTNLGYLYIDQGHHYRAKVLCYESLKIFAQRNDNYGLAHTETHLGVLYIRQKKWDKAQQHLEQACNLWKTMPDPDGTMQGFITSGLMQDFINLGLLYMEMKDFEKALVYLEKALHQAKKAGDKIGIGSVYLNMSICHRLNHNLNEAINTIQQAKSIYEALLITTHLIHVWNNMGAIYLEQGKLTQAFKYLKRALDLSRNLNNVNGELDTLINLIKYEMAKNNIYAAINWLTKAEHLIMKQNKQSLFIDFTIQLKEFRHTLFNQSD